MSKKVSPWAAFDPAKRLSPTQPIACALVVGDREA